MKVNLNGGREYDRPVDTAFWAVLGGLTQKRLALLDELALLVPEFSYAVHGADSQASARKSADGPRLSVERAISYSFTCSVVRPRSALPGGPFLF